MIGYDKEGNQHKIIDTKQCQINSVIAFMKILGFNYTPNEFIHEAPGFYNLLSGRKGINSISFSTAIYLHNTSPLGYNYSFPKEKISRACLLLGKKAKIVELAKLQYSRKNKKITCQNHMVTFTSIENQALYLGEI